MRGQTERNGRLCGERRGDGRTSKKQHVPKKSGSPFHGDRLPGASLGDGVGGAVRSEAVRSEERGAGGWQRRKWAMGKVEGKWR